MLADDVVALVAPSGLSARRKQSADVADLQLAVVGLGVKVDENDPRHWAPRRDSAQPERRAWFLADKVQAALGIVEARCRRPKRLANSASVVQPSTARLPPLA